MKCKYLISEIIKLLNVARSTVVCRSRESRINPLKLRGHNPIIRKNPVEFFQTFDLPFSPLDGSFKKRILVEDGLDILNGS